MSMRTGAGSTAASKVAVISAGYSPEPKRGFALVLTVLVFCLPLVFISFLSWRTVAAQAPVAPHLATFDVTEPAPSKDEPLPEQAEPETEPEPDPTAVTQPSAVPPPPVVIGQTSLARAAPVTPAPIAPTQPSPAPPSPPPAQTVARKSPGSEQGPDTWHARVLGRLNAVKTYPGSARARRQQGTVMVRFSVDRKGQVLSVTLHKTSGFASLDREALALPKRTSPLPPPPAEVRGNSIELVVPVEFYF
ncbi:energy transducer TonB [Novosphingobium sp. ZW T3_23]|uniref:energy transducer TonB family protein n=1 Tax=Novosphingobium sp. ZW T3_23 TaxID=3378084 RepID=UPI003853973A